jgi:hypothetical protein
MLCEASNAVSFSIIRSTVDGGRHAPLWSACAIRWKPYPLVAHIVLQKNSALLSRLLLLNPGLMTTVDERLVPDLLRDRGKSIGRDLDVGKEGSEQTIVTLQSLHQGSDGYQHMRTRVGLATKAYPYKCNREHKQEQERMQLNLLINV